MHLCVFWGFLVLLVFHALGSIFATMIDPAYVSTINPFLAVRNVAGLVLVVGLVLAVVRRIAQRATLHTSAADKSVIAILVVIAVTGFLLEGLKITSNGEFNRMVTDYAGGALSEADTAALRGYWVDQFGLVVPQPVASHTAAPVELGKGVHATYCQSCHAAPQSAFVSYAVSRVMAPVALSLDEAGGVKGLWWIHVLACCLGLVWVAYSKMFHVVSTPVSLIVAEVSGTHLTPAAVAMRQMIELDGCSHGGACHDTCPVKLRRLDRIGGEAPYAPMLTYLGNKSARDLGSRPV
jgi:nitrate reductase gamma subunit